MTDSVTPGADYYLDNYGTCKAEPCACRRPNAGPWRGRACGNWQPLGVESFEDLVAYGRWKGGERKATIDWGKA